jgi:predicted transcriptional regulator
MGIDKKIFESDVHVKIIKFFHENQASIDTPRGVATWINEERAKVKSALEDLVKANILVAHRATSTTGYSYTNDDKIIARIDKFFKNSKSS